MEYKFKVYKLFLSRKTSGFPSGGDGDHFGLSFGLCGEHSSMPVTEKEYTTYKKLYTESLKINEMPF